MNVKEFRRLYELHTLSCLSKYEIHEYQQLKKRFLMLKNVLPDKLWVVARLRMLNRYKWQDISKIIYKSNTKSDVVRITFYRALEKSSFPIHNKI